MTDGKVPAPDQVHRLRLAKNSEGLRDLPTMPNCREVMFVNGSEKKCLFRPIDLERGEQKSQPWLRRKNENKYDKASILCNSDRDYLSAWLKDS